LVTFVGQRFARFLSYSLFACAETTKVLCCLGNNVIVEFEDDATGILTSNLDVEKDSASFWSGGLAGRRGVRRGWRLTGLIAHCECGTCKAWMRRELGQDASCGERSCSKTGELYCRTGGGWVLCFSSSEWKVAPSPAPSGSSGRLVLGLEMQRHGQQANMSGQERQHPYSLYTS